MISSIGFVFVVLPCIGATLAGAVLFDWRLAAAAICGALGLVFVMPMLPAAVSTLSLPLVLGVAIGAAVVLGLLIWRPSSDVWSRMLWTLGITFALSYIHLNTAKIGP